LGDGSAEPLADGALGLLINPDDVRALARAIVSVLNGTHGHPLLGDPVALRREAIARFGFPAFVRRLQALVSASDV
jgi:glycosyltransferase involved in cell wall biosynthesis